MKVTPAKCLSRLNASLVGRGQQGVALITALMVVSLTAVVAVSVASRQELDVRRTANLLQADQAYVYALGVETWAQVILEQDKKDSESDHLEEDWATIIPPIAVDGGQVAGRIEDLQGRFNINNLLVGSGEDNENESGDDNENPGNAGSDQLPSGSGGENKPEGTDSADHVKQFKRLLNILELDEDLVNALLDWMDVNIDTRFPEGAEDDVYLALEKPYRAANGPLVSISELRLVKGFDTETVTKLTPHVAVLDGATTINVNTATDMVLRSLVDDMSQSDAETLIEARSGEGFETMQAFLQHNVLAGRQVNAGLLSLDSAYFLVHAEVNIGTVRTQLYSVIHREEKASTVAFRSRGSE